MTPAGERDVLVWNDVIPNETLQLVEDLVPVGVELVCRAPSDEALPRGEDALFLLASGSYRVDASVLDRTSKLKAVVKFGAGTETLDLEALERAELPAYNTPGANAKGVAEHTIALMLSVLRHIPLLEHRLRHEGLFDKWSYRHRSHELAGRTVGIVGFGNVGQQVALRLRGFEVDVVATARRPIAPGRAAAAGARVAELDELLGASDVVCLTLPLSSETRHLIGSAALARMKDGAYLINVSRGALIDSEAVADALESGRLAGYAADVFDPEPPPRDHRLFAFENTVLTPHMAGSTVETFRRTFGLAMEHVAGIRAGRWPEERFRVV